jgi:hypothetical protein
VAFPRQERFPLDPLIRVADLKYPTDPRHPHTSGLLRVLAQEGMPRINMTRWKRAGGVPTFSADRLAVSLGEWPGALWPDWIERGVDA